MSYERGVAINAFPFGLVSRSTGQDITSGPVTIYITKDGIQSLLTGTPEYEGNGQWTVSITSVEMDADIIGLVITHADAITSSFTIKTVTEPIGSFITGVSQLVGGVSVYGSLAGAQTYYDQRLNVQPWEDALVSDRNKALIMSTRAIDKLNFLGSKNSESQQLQFPRGNDTVVPLDIEIAAYECVLEYLDGFNIEEETRSLGVVSNRGWQAGSTYNPAYVNTHIRNGIPSSEAWFYLLPYLVDNTAINLSRV